MSISKLRIGKDITIKMSILTNGEPVSLDGRDISVVLKTPMCQEVKLDFTTEDNIIISKYEGTKQKYCGVYMLTVWENYGKIGQSALDFCNAFELVSNTCKEVPTSEGLEIETITLEGDLSIGIQGASAYEIAVENGFVGTEQEWLASLKGEKGDIGPQGPEGEKGDKGDKGDIGEAFSYSDFTPEQIAELQRPATEAAQTANEAAKLATDAASNIPNVDVLICSTPATTSAKEVTMPGFVLGSKTRLLIKMNNMADCENATLTVNNSAGSAEAKPLMYNGRRASINNTWVAGDVLDVYYDGTNYHSSNYQGASGVTEINVSITAPKGGTNQSNKYTLSTALEKIADVPKSLQVVGFKCSFLNDNGEIETAVYQGGTWNKTTS